MTLDVDRENEWDDLRDRTSRPPYLLGAAHILNAASAQTEFLVPNAIPAEAITMIVGHPGSAKSWLAYDLAIKVARGGSWLGKPCKQGSVLVLSYDNPPKECGRRFLRLGLQPDDPIAFHVPDGPTYLRIGAHDKLPDGTLQRFSHADALRGMVQRQRPALVVVDSFRQAHVLDENSSNDMGKVMAEIKSWVSEGAAVVVVHHATLTESSELKARGSGEITGSADATILVRNGKADWGKTRSWAMPEGTNSIEFELIDPTDTTTELRSADPLRDVPPETIAEVRAYLQANPDATVRDVCSAVQRKRNQVAKVVKALRASVSHPLPAPLPESSDDGVTD